jgi:hypothetical protein
MRKIVPALCFSAAMLFLPFWVERVNGTFRLVKVAIDIPFNPAWKSDLLSNDVRSVFSRPFFYLGRGAQAFVFESEDGRFVLKLFRGSPRIHPWMRFVRNTLRGKKERTSVKDKIPPLFAACKLAYTEARALTGIVYMHLNTTTNELQSTFLINRMKRKIPVDLNQCRFVLQKKGRSISDGFMDAIEKKDRGKYVRLAQSVVSLLKERTEKKISNSDTTLWYNFGFLDETAIEWDFGRYYYNPDLNQLPVREQEMRFFTHSLQEFLNRAAPEWPINLEEFL